MNTLKILKKYKTIPKCNLLNDITPLQNLDKIARQFGLQNLYVKRDDHTNELQSEWHGQLKPNARCPLLSAKLARHHCAFPDHRCNAPLEFLLWLRLL